MGQIKFNSGASLNRRIGVLYLVVPEGHKDAVEKLIKESVDRGDNLISVELTRIRRPRSTRERGQSRRFRGHCRDIAEQVVDENGDPLHTPEQIAEAIKRMAVEEGYPEKISLDGFSEPKSTADATVEEMQLLLETQQRFADEHEMWLTEYDDMGREYRSVAGRPLGEIAT